MKKILSVFLAVLLICTTGINLLLSSAAEGDAPVNKVFDFENATVTDFTFSESTTPPTKSMETTNPISGTSSLKLELAQGNNSATSSVGLVLGNFNTAKTYRVSGKYRVDAGTLATTSAINGASTGMNHISNWSGVKAANPARIHMILDGSVVASSTVRTFAGTVKPVSGGGNIVLYTKAANSSAGGATVIFDDITVAEMIEAPTATGESSMGTVLVTNKAGYTDFAAGETAVFTATAADGCSFSHWTDATGATVSTSATYEHTLTDSIALTANFKVAGVTTFDFENVSEYQFTAIAKSGYESSQSIETTNAISGSGSWKIAFPKAASAYNDGAALSLGNFSTSNTYRVSGKYRVISGTLGVARIVNSATNTNFDHIFSAAIPAGRQFEIGSALNAPTSVRTFSGTIKPTSNSGFIALALKPASGSTAEVVFDDITVAEIVTAPTAMADAAKGTATVANKAGYSDYAIGETAVFTATANNGYRFVAWEDETGATVSTDAVYNQVLSKTIALTAKFESEQGGGTDGPTIQYGDFENVPLGELSNVIGAGKTPTDTPRTWFRATGASTVLSETVGDTTNKYLHLKNIVYYGFGQNVLKKGASYDLSFSLRASETCGSAASIVVSMTAGNERSGGQVILNSEVYNVNASGISKTGWKTYTYRFTLKNNVYQNGGTDYTIDTIKIADYAGTNDRFLIDNVSLVEVTQSTVSFAGTPTPLEAITGGVGESMTLPAAPEKAGHYFDGWYTDAAFTKPADVRTFPSTDTTFYAKYVEGSLGNMWKQNFENYSYSLTPSSTQPFVLYQAANATDNNVFDGSYALKKNVIASGEKYVKVGNDQMNLTVGNGYKLTLKLKVTKVERTSYINFRHISQRDNEWSYGSNPALQIAAFPVGYDKTEEWVEHTFFFVAQTPYFALSAASGIEFYLDDIRVEEAAVVDINFVLGEGLTLDSVTGVSGQPFNIKPTTAPEGKKFAGWYTDAELKNTFSSKTFPASNVTLYARWLNESSFEQDFEFWPFQPGTNAMSSTFTLYEAKDANDPNVYNGSYSLFYNGMALTERKTTGFTIFDSTTGKLQLGEKYKMTVRYKPVETVESTSPKTPTSNMSLYYTKSYSNFWNGYVQGPMVRYATPAFKETSFTDENWTGTTGVTTTTLTKDANGWLTATYEFTATSDYLALFFTGYFDMYIDTINVDALPSGVVVEDYESPYCEPFYNELGVIDVMDSLNGSKKQVFEIPVNQREDYVFTAILKKIGSAKTKVYLAWDKEGNQPIDKTVFTANSSSAKLSSSRMITNFNKEIYLIVENGSADAISYLAFFPTKYATDEDWSNPIVPDMADYENLTTRDADSTVVVQKDDTDNTEDNLEADGSATQSPTTGEANILIVCLLILGACTILIVAVFRKGARD